MASIAFDRSVLKVNQMILMVTIVAGYVIGLAYPGVAWILPVLAVMMLAAVASPSLNVPPSSYTQVLRPSGIVKPRIVQEDPAPHRFAQLVGGVFLDRRHDLRHHRICCWSRGCSRGSSLRSPS